MKRYCYGCEKNRDLKFWAKVGQASCDTCRRKARSASAHRARIKVTYGLEADDWDALQIAQDEACAGCGGKRGYRLNVDHDHATGLVRGLLCRRCNKVLRDVRDDIDILSKLMWYLIDPPAKLAGIVAKVSTTSFTQLDLDLD